MNNQLKITILGGQEEIGLNSTAIETEDDLVLIDLGNKFEDEEFGVDFYIPNIDLLTGKNEKVRGLLITHGHYDHRAAIPYLIDKLGNPPVYGSPFTIQLIKQQLKNLNKDKHVRLNTLSPRQEINLGKIHVKAIHLTHSIVGSYGYFLKTPHGNIFHTGDFKFDDAPFNEELSDYQSLHQAEKEGLLALLIDSTRANFDGHSRSETAIAQNLEKLISQAEGRVIVSTFAQMLSRINQIALIGKKFNRHVFIEGLTLERTTRIGKEMGILSKELKFKDAREMENYSDSQILLFATGSQGEEKAALSRMSDIKKGFLKIKPSDTVILSSSSIPANAIAIQKLIDKLADRGCQVITDDIVDIHAGGHGHQDEIKQMIEILKPKFVFPVEGYLSFRHRLAQITQDLGYQKNQIILAKNNQSVALSQKSFQIKSLKKKNPGVVINERVIKNGHELIRQRKRAGRKGLLVIFINRRKRKIDLTSWGVPEFVLQRIDQKLIRKNIRHKKIKAIKKAIRRSLQVFIEDEFIPAIQVEFI